MRSDLDLGQESGTPSSKTLREKDTDRARRLTSIPGSSSFSFSFSLIIFFDHLFDHFLPPSSAAHPSSRERVDKGRGEKTESRKAKNEMRNEKREKEKKRKSEKAKKGERMKLARLERVGTE